jgi:hypothetical protein
MSRVLSGLAGALGNVGMNAADEPREA